MTRMCIFGLQWGDEGKGKIVDTYVDRVQRNTGTNTFVVRFQGGANAGHTVYVEGKKYVFHLIPAGILHYGVRCILGNGMVIHREKLLTEVQELNKLGVNTSFISVSSRAHVIADEDLKQDADTDKVGTTKNGIGPCYANKALRTGRRVEDIDLPGISIVDAGEVLREAIKREDNIIFEAAQGVMLDIDHGTYPYVTSSHTGPHGIFAGCGIPINTEIDLVGVTKAYCTRVGLGPFPSEIADEEEAEAVRKLGNEYGATTGRPRRTGWLDLRQLRYALDLTGCRQIVVTKLDVLERLGYVKFVDLDGVVREMRSFKFTEPGNPFLAYISRQLNVEIVAASVGMNRLDIAWT